MADNDKRIAELKDQIAKAQQMKYKIEARLDELKKAKEAQIAQLTQLNVAPENLEGEIARLTTEVDALLTEAAGFLPADLLRAAV